MADLLIPVIPPKIREKLFRRHEFFLTTFQTRSFEVDTDLAEILLNFSQNLKTM